ncbi:hypothetical protein JRQ81_004047 [Phrynocephalus forsythii]|uniref:Peptidase S1 domain-containing protein n=1 Tax=Phrynocephalus forsythii TaxID=171643 RepID=A0A9Q0XLZ9_9SAUR|nr:hypothetical protein JRQ81_004047 [Phrynocephalus forsythii]
MRRRFRPAADSFWTPLVVFLSQALLAESNSEECGTRPGLDKIETETRIIGGQDAQPGAWPWQVSLQIYRLGIGYVHVCGGSLINNKSLLTAAHCAQKRMIPDAWRAVSGLHHLSDHKKHTIKSRVKTITLHPGFSKNSFENDIALFTLSKSITYNDYVQPICLPYTSLPLNENTNCYISGWGLKGENGSGSQVLQYGNVQYIPREICNSFGWYEGAVSKNYLCAGYESGRVDSCEGDSGGPLMCILPNDNKFYLVGLTSQGYGCGRPRLPGIYVHLAKYRKWIDLKLRSKTTTICVQHILLFLTMINLTLFYNYLD